MENKALNLLGLAERARKILFGSDTVEKALQSKKAKMVIVSSDSSTNTIDKFKKKCFYYNIPLILNFNSSEISQAVGKQNCKVIAICDQGFSKSLEKLVKDGVLNET